MAYDPSSYVTEATKLAGAERGYGDTQWNTLSGAMAKNYATSDEVAANAKGAGSMWGGQAQKTLDMYSGQYMPAMQQQLDFAKGYATDARKALNRGQAVSGAAQAGNAALDNAKQTLASYGVRDPSGGRGASALRSSLVGIGGSEAAAGTQSDINTEMTGQQLLGGAINTGLQLPGQAATGTGVQLAAGNQQSNVGLATTATGAQTMGTPVQWYGMAGPQLAQWNSALMGSDQLALQREQLAAQSGNAGFTGAMGGLGALNGLFGSSGMFGSGGALGGLLSMAPAAALHEGGTIPGYAAGGGAINTGRMVPTSASPSGGAQQDDVNARVEPGEFVMPQHATSWYGEKFMQNLIEKANKERAEKTVARPQMKRMPPAQQGQPPTFVSQPAIQTGAP